MSMWNNKLNFIKIEIFIKYYIYDFELGKELWEVVFDKLWDKLIGCFYLVLVLDGDLNLVLF